jgi:hypothetical protein
MRALPCVLAVLAAATACSGTREQRLATCAKEVTRAQSAPLRRSLRGDVDGDGHADSVAVVSPPRSRMGCRFFIAVRTRGRTAVTPVHEAPQHQAAPALAPTVGLLAAIDRRPGLEIVAVIDHGASSTQFAIFTVRDKVVERMNCAPCDRGGEFFEDHALTHFATVDCVRAGRGVIAQVYGENFVSRSDRWSTEVRIYRADGNDFRLTVRRQFVTRAPSYGLPFANCSGVHLQ